MDEQLGDSRFSSRSIGWIFSFCSSDSRFCSSFSESRVFSPRIGGLMDEQLGDSRHRADL